MKKLLLIILLVITSSLLQAQVQLNPCNQLPSELQNRKNVHCSNVDTFSCNLYRVTYTDSTPNNGGTYFFYIYKNKFNSKIRQINDSIFYYAETIDNTSNNQNYFLINENGDIIRKLVAGGFLSQNDLSIEGKDYGKSGFIIYGKYLPYNRIGILNPKGKDFVAPIYREITELNKHCFALKKNDSKWIVMNSKKKIIVPIGFDKLFSLNEKYFIGVKKYSFETSLIGTGSESGPTTLYHSKGQYYLINSKGQIISNSSFYQELKEPNPLEYHEKEYYKEWLLNNNINFN